MASIVLTWSRESFELAQRQWGRNPSRRVTAAAPSKDKGSESCRVPLRFRADLRVYVFGLALGPLQGRPTDIRAEKEKK